MEIRCTSFIDLLRINFILFVLIEAVLPIGHHYCGNIIHYFFSSADFEFDYEKNLLLLLLLKNHHHTDIILLALRKISICETFSFTVKAVSHKETET
jgi:hypothetical protein